jgi:hypothetical protein
MQRRSQFSNWGQIVEAAIPLYRPPQSYTREFPNLILFNRWMSMHLTLTDIRPLLASSPLLVSLQSQHWTTTPFFAPCRSPVIAA